VGDERWYVLRPSGEVQLSTGDGDGAQYTGLYFDNLGT